MNDKLNQFAGQRYISLETYRRNGTPVRTPVVDMAVQPVEQLEAVIPPPASVRQQHKCLQLSQALARPQRRSEGQPLIQGDRVQTVFDHRPDADESEPMFDERAQIARRRIGNPHHGEAVVLQEIQEVPCIAAIGLDLADYHRSDLRGLADEERMTKALQERVEPQGVAGALDADGDRGRQGGVEAFDVVADVGQLLVPELARGRVEQSDLLLARVQIASDENHEFSLHLCDVGVLASTEATSDVWLFS